MKLLTLEFLLTHVKFPHLISNLLNKIFFVVPDIYDFLLFNLEFILRIEIHWIHRNFFNDLRLAYWLWLFLFLLLVIIIILLLVITIVFIFIMQLNFFTIDSNGFEFRLRFRIIMIPISRLKGLFQVLQCQIFWHFLYFLIL